MSLQHSLLHGNYFFTKQFRDMPFLFREITGKSTQGEKLWQILELQLLFTKWKLL